MTAENPAAESRSDGQRLTGARRDLVYISYSHRDRLWHETICRFLASDTEVRDRLWDDRKIPPGADVAREIAEHLARAAVIIMITSPAYLDPQSGASRYEIQPALQASKLGELKILWVPVKAHSYSAPPIGHIMAALGPDPIPLERLRRDELDQALLLLLKAVRQCLGLSVTSTKGTGTGNAIPDERIAAGPDALSLSGGGYRATFFHLGALAFHFRRGSLENLKVITAVSGGAILAAHALLNWETLKRDENGFREVMASLVSFARSNLRDTILIPWLWSVGTAWRFVGNTAARVRKSRTGRLVYQYQRHFSENTLGDLYKPNRPTLSLIATDLFNASRVYFSYDGMRRFSIEANKKEEPFPHTINLPVAFGVAASSSFPPIFRPLLLDCKVLYLRWEEFKLELRLQDGGVHDNLGLRALQLIYPGKGSLHLIHSSYAVNPGNIDKPATGIVSDRKRAFQIFTRGESAEIANDIATLAGATAVITKLADRVPTTGPHLLEDVAQTALMKCRTDLDAPTWQELYALMAHGYQVTAFRFNHVDREDFIAARAMFCGILAESRANSKGTKAEDELPFIDNIVTKLDAEQLSRCRVRPKRRILLHLAAYLTLLGSVLFAAGKPIWDWTHRSKPTIQTNPASVASGNVTLQATVIDNGHATILERRFEWAKAAIRWGGGTKDVDHGVVYDAQIVGSRQTFSAVVGNLQMNTVYKYRAYVKNSVGWSDPAKTNTVQFSTGPP